ncbi:MAG: hypothetical protein HYY76_09540 [Acidobacteria bacterium]|nr:hypothetical protein [Acidobacteriota bacterium]
MRRVNPLSLPLAKALVGVASLAVVVALRIWMTAGGGAETAGVTGNHIARVPEVYGRLPLSFEANYGQTDSRVKFLSRGSGYTLFLTSTEAVFILGKAEATSETVLRMTVVGANAASAITGLEALPGTVNSFIGGDPSTWRTNIPSYARVKYQNVYPGVDLIYYGNQRRLEYDFVVAPGGDPNAIELAFEGAMDIERDASGDLVVRTAGGDLHMHKF